MQSLYGHLFLPIFPCSCFACKIFEVEQLLQLVEKGTGHADTQDHFVLKEAFTFDKVDSFALKTKLPDGELEMCVPLHPQF